MNLRPRIIAIVLSTAVWFGLHQTAQAFYNPSAGRWLNRDPIGEGGYQNLARIRKLGSSLGEGNLHQFVYNDPLNSIDPIGLDVYKVHIPAGISTGGSSVDHREIVGDDGKGGIYILSFNQCPKCGVHISGASFFGSGEVTVTRARNISAEDWISENGGTIKRHEVTPNAHVDEVMSDYADAYAKTKPFYILLFNDCGTIANRFMDDAKKAVERWDERNFPRDY